MSAFYKERTGAQRGEVTSPRSYSSHASEIGLEARPAWPQSPALSCSPWLATTFDTTTLSPWTCYVATPRTFPQGPSPRVLPPRIDTGGQQIQPVMGQTHPAVCSENKVLLEPSHTHLLHIVSLTLCSDGKLRSTDTANLKYLLSGPLQKTPLSLDLQ